MPSWTKKDAPTDHYRMFNARSESVEEKGALQALLRLPNSVQVLLTFRLGVQPPEEALLWQSSGLVAGVFNRLLKGHRCIVLLNGFYEWAKVSNAVWTMRSL